MSLPPQDERRLIPRWRSYTDTVTLGELAPLHSGAPRNWKGAVGARERLEHDFWTKRTGPHAADLVGSALVLGSSHPALEAARDLLAERVTSTAMARAVARTLLAQTEGPRERPVIVALDEEQHPGALHELRRRLRGNPRNAVRWSDLSRLHTILGQPNKASDAMKIAMALAPNDRYVLRSAARLAVHEREYDRAHAIVAGARATPSDPWLIASELAIADLSGSRPAYVRRAREMLGDSRYSDFSVNELASALATLELEAGDHRASRRLFRRALKSPSENTLAQVAWARSHVGLPVEDHVFEAPGSFEARAVAAHGRGDWRASSDEAGRWQDDQPFASRPAELGSYEASKGGDFELGARFAVRGLIANPDEFLLRNNAAFCLLSAGDIDAARPHLVVMAKQSLDFRERPVALATRGLFHYRTGDRDAGLACYREAIKTARDARQRTLARLMLAREERRHGSPEAAAVLRTALRALEAAHEREIEPWLDQVGASLPTRHGSR